jgi:hypothetical protein
MNFFPVVLLAPADGDVFIGARSAQHGGTRALTLATAVELSSARRKAVAEQYPYDTARVAYLGCLADALALDLITTTPVLPFVDGGDKRATQSSAVTEFFLLVLGLVADYERARDLDRACAALIWADAGARAALSTSVLSERLGTILASLDAWTGTIDIAYAARKLRSPLKDAERIHTARWLRDLATKVAGNAACESEALRLELAAMRDAEPRFDHVPDRVLFLKATEQDGAAQRLMSEHSAKVVGLSELMHITLDDARTRARAILYDAIGDAPSHAKDRPPVPVFRVPASYVKFDLEDVAGPLVTLSIPRALELRSYAVEGADTVSVSALDAWLQGQGYTMRRENVKDALLAAGLTAPPPSLPFFRSLISAVKARLPGGAPRVLTWDEWLASPPPAAEWTVRPSDWHSWLPAEDAVRHAGMAAYPRSTWKAWGVPRPLLPPRATRAPMPAQGTGPGTVLDDDDGPIPLRYFTY